MDYSAIDANLKPGWLSEKMREVGICQRACQKVLLAANAARKNSRTQPTKVEFTIPELMEMAGIVRRSGLSK